MLSIDQFLRFICVPAVLAAFFIASQISDAMAPQPTVVQAMLGR